MLGVFLGVNMKDKSYI